jgi:hypothetical protein
LTLFFSSSGKFSIRRFSTTSSIDEKSSISVVKDVLMLSCSVFDVSFGSFGA